MGLGVGLGPGKGNRSPKAFAVSVHVTSTAINSEEARIGPLLLAKADKVVPYHQNSRITAPKHWTSNRRSQFPGVGQSP
jgi:hypothetical protein